MSDLNSLHQQVAPDALFLARSMLSQPERIQLYHLARDYYSGSGKIVDAGAFIGGSAYAFGLGLSENKKIKEKNKSKLIHSYDMFKIKGRYYLDFIECNFFVYQQQPHREPTPLVSTDGEYDFEFIYLYQTERFRDYITHHKGNVTKFSWSANDPIEILFVDIVKAKLVNDHVVPEFFPALIPGKSILIQQDYYSMLTYIHISMEALSDCFERVTDGIGGSSMFLCKNKVSPERAAEAVAASSDKDEGIRLYRRLLSTPNLADSGLLHTGLVHFMIEHGLNDQATEEAARCIATHSNNGERAHWWSIMQKQLLPKLEEFK